MAGLIIDHTDPEYQKIWMKAGANQHNGAYYYSREIVENIVPRVDTDRNWVTIHQHGRCLNYSVVFIHNNLHPQLYEWMKAYRDLVLVCGVPSTCEKVAYLGRPVYLPLSVDVSYVERFIREKDKGTAYVGRPAKRKGEVSRVRLPRGIDYLEGMVRPTMLNELARYEKVYAVGRCAIEAKVLGCEVLPFDPRFPDPSVWKVIDNADAAAILQGLLDAIDG